LCSRFIGIAEVWMPLSKFT